MSGIGGKSLAKRDQKNNHPESTPTLCTSVGVAQMHPSMKYGPI